MTSIPIGIRLLAVFVSSVYLAGVVLAMRDSRMSVRQSLLWLFSGVGFLALSLFPAPFIWLGYKLGFVAPSNGTFLAWLLALTAMMFYQSLTTSRQAEQAKILAQEIALLRASLQAAQSSDARKQSEPRHED